LSRYNKLPDKDSRDEEESEVEFEDPPANPSSESDSSLAPISNESLSAVKTNDSSLAAISNDSWLDAKPNIRKVRPPPVKLRMMEPAANKIRVDVLSRGDSVQNKEDQGCHEPIVTVKQMKKPGMIVSFRVDTKKYPALPPLDLRVFCPNYKPKQVWVNGKECTY
uniref:Major sperm protein n=1 Tax=Gongylonema pulchrum TaxID=637853 RepID=A0A183DSY7_9BILA